MTTEFDHDDELPPCIGARYRDVLGDLFHRAVRDAAHAAQRPRSSEDNGSEPDDQ